MGTTVILKYNGRNEFLDIMWIDSFIEGSVNLQLRDDPDGTLEEWLSNKDTATIVVKSAGKETKYTAINPSYDKDEKIITFNYGIN